MKWSRNLSLKIKNGYCKRSEESKKKKKENKKLKDKIRKNP